MGLVPLSRRRPQLLKETETAMVMMMTMMTTTMREEGIGTPRPRPRPSRRFIRLTLLVALIERLLLVPLLLSILCSMEARKRLLELSWDRLWPWFFWLEVLYFW